MQAEKWKKIKQILREVVELNSHERKNYLDTLKLAKEIREEINSLLAYEDTAEELMPLTAVELAKDLFEGKENSLIGSKIGIYEIVKELGYGGMGAVYLANRADKKFEQKVAIKMLRREFNTEKIRERFKNEKKIQASLVHQNVASLLDAGTTKEGIPYLVMEYVKGIPIDKCCRKHNLGLNERLKLFNKVCETVSHAHQNLVVHRDLKPSNILVTEKGEPKLLDFGISKILDAEHLKTSATTKFGAMTPEYASPEQLEGKDVTTATDIYSLGIVLFKMLTGTYPYEVDFDKNSELQKVISEQEPISPSTAITRNLDEILEDIPAKISPNKLKGDIDNIVLKAIRKEPERRYKTVEQFSADIWRFIDGLPITARPNTLSYKISKLYSRNKIPVIAGLLTVLGLISGITIAGWQANVAREQAKIAEQSRQIAEASKKTAEAEAKKSKEEKERAEEISKFMAKIISFANPGIYAEGYESKGQAKVIDVINELGDKIEKDFSDRKDISSELHHKFAEVYVMLARQVYEDKSQFDKFLKQAQFHARRALQLRKEFYGEKHELVAKDLYYLASSGAEGEKGGIKLIAQAIRMMRETNPNNPNFPQMLTDYANRLHGIVNEELQEIYFKEANPSPNITPLELAENYYKEALKVFSKQHSNNHFVVLWENCHIALIMAKQKKFEELKPFLEVCKNATRIDYNDAQQKVIEGQIKTINELIEEKQKVKK